MEITTSSGSKTATAVVATPRSNSLFQGRCDVPNVICPPGQAGVEILGSTYRILGEISEFFCYKLREGSLVISLPPRLIFLATPGGRICIFSIPLAVMRSPGFGE